MADTIELEGELLGGLVNRAVELLADLCEREGVRVRRLLDIGCGPGGGTWKLAESFPSASIVAVDGSATMLERLRARAEHLGLAPRVEARLLELPDGLSTLGRADVAWASMVLHHISDEVGALHQLHRLLAPVGLLAVVERDRPLRVVLDDELGRPGLWPRLDQAWAAWFAGLRADLPGSVASTGYPAMLAAGGFEVLADEMLALELVAPLDARGRRFALQHLERAQAQLAPYADASDLEALGVLIDEQSDRCVLARDDVGLRAVRRLYVAKPGAPLRR